MREPKEDTRHLPCPRCGSAMNRHAEKLVFWAEKSAGSSHPAASVGFEEQGLVDEFHTCTHCRYVLERQAR